MTLRDGRRLGYAVYGDPAGVPVLSCHGGLVGRLDASGVDEEAQRFGARVVSPDRPGVGLSDRWPGHSTLDWADDVAQLLDATGIVRFACMGWSMGGQYAAAVAYRFPTRVTRAAIVAGCLPLVEPGRLAELGRLDRLIARGSVRSRPMGRVLIAGLRLGASRSERRLGLPSGAMSDALRITSGIVDEYRAFAAPWGFGLDAIEVPIDVWQGTADELVPPSWGAEIASRLPVGSLVTVEGGDHMIGITRRADIVRVLASSVAEERP
jgi:pimeloyl-ACP methyl ester carboxylesterase